MDEIELAIRGEIFRISEQTGPDGQTSYHFSWLNGPSGGSYGFTVGRFGVGSDSTSAEGIPQMTHERLISEVQGFIAAFYEAGGIGEQDFPDTPQLSLETTTSLNPILEHQVIVMQLVTIICFVSIVCQR